MYQDELWFSSLLVIHKSRQQQKIVPQKKFHYRFEKISNIEINAALIDALGYLWFSIILPKEKSQYKLEDCKKAVSLISSKYFKYFSHANRDRLAILVISTKLY